MIETERLVLRLWREADRASYLATCNTPAVTEFLGGPATVEQIDQGLARIRQSQAEHGFCFWALERKADHALLGYCGLKRVHDISPAIEGDVEIGWRLREDAWEQGYAREAATACLDWAWTHLDVPQVVAMTVPANAPSWGLMERLGMTRVAEGDFDHPALAEDHPLRHHIVYRIARPTRSANPG